MLPPVALASSPTKPPLCPAAIHASSHPSNHTTHLPRRNSSSVSSVGTAPSSSSSKGSVASRSAMRRGMWVMTVLVMLSVGLHAVNFTKYKLQGRGKACMYILLGNTTVRLDSKLAAALKELRLPPALEGTPMMRADDSTAGHNIIGLPLEHDPTVVPLGTSTTEAATTNAATLSPHPEVNPSLGSVGPSRSGETEGNHTTELDSSNHSSSGALMEVNVTATLLRRWRALLPLIPAAVLPPGGAANAGIEWQRHDSPTTDGLHRRGAPAQSIVARTVVANASLRLPLQSDIHALEEEWQAVDYECTDSYNVPLPIFLDAEDERKWIVLQRPYDGCDFVERGSQCRFNGGCSSHQVIRNAQLVRGKMGECRNHPYLETQRWDSELCDARILVPLDVSEGLYFGQLHNMLQRLLRLWFRESARERNLWQAGDRTGQPPRPKFLLYTQDGRQRSRDTTDVLERLGVEVTTTFPEQCFKRILWGCHIVNFDPTTPKLMSGLMRQLFSEPTVDRSSVHSMIAPTLPMPQRVLLYRKGMHHVQAEYPYVRMQSSIYQPTLPTRPDPSVLGETDAQRHKPVAHCTHVYASRFNSDAKNGRHMPNEPDLIDHLRMKHHFCILDGGESLQTWADALRHAKVFMGAHGGALMHTYWLDPKNDPVVIELDGYNKYTIFWLHAASAGFRYAWMSFSRETGVDLGRVDALLDQVQSSANNALRLYGRAPMH